MIPHHAPRTPHSRPAFERKAHPALGRLSMLLFASFLSISLVPTGHAQPATSPAGEASPPGGNRNDKSEPKKEAAPAAPAMPDAAAMSRFLHRLMIAESGGRDMARNPRSTAVGPFQFIESTFLNVARRHFAAEVGELSPAEILRLRTNRVFATRAAEAFTRDNAAILAVAGHEPSFANLRLAHLVGPGGAVRVLKAAASAPAGSLLGGHVARANPFMAGMTAGDLIQWSARNIAGAAGGRGKIVADPSRATASKGDATKPAINVRCNRALASCRRWVALATSRLTRKERVAGATPRRRR